MNKKENLILYIFIWIKNIISLALWAILAITFNKWWISLFSILFLSYSEGGGSNESRRYYVIK